MSTIIKMLTPRERKEEVFYGIHFSWIEDPNGGFSFPCDEQGNINTHDKNYRHWGKNYKWCLAHPELVKNHGVVKDVHSYTECATGRCSCGTTVFFSSSTNQCDGCGQYYNLFGQALLPPDQWGWDGTPMEEDEF